ncbi:MAG: TIGR02270 family protein [Polyangiaceae bacterium]
MSRSLDLEIVAESSSEATFLWRLRDGAAVGAQHDADTLAALDERIEANLDGVRIAGATGLDVAAKGLDPDEPGSVFALALLAIEQGDTARRDEALDLAEASASAARGAVTALAFLSFDAGRDTLRALLAPQASAARRRIGLAACAAHRRDPGEALSYAIVDADARLRARALRAVGEFGRAVLLGELSRELGAEDPDVRFWAAWSATLLGDSGGASALLAIAERPGPHAERAASVAIRKVEAREARRRIEDAGAIPELARAAVVAAGALGDPALVPWLLARAEEDALARLAAESIARITGVGIEGPLAGSPKRDGGPSDDPRDDRVAMDPDDALPWPDVGALAAWWRLREGQLARGARYLRGTPVSADAAEREIAAGNQPRRASAAIELAIQRPGRALAEVRARGGRAVLPR